MKDDKDFIIDNFFWEVMPLEESQLVKIPESHRVRPYFIFTKNDMDEYYGFPCTSSHKFKEATFSNNWLELRNTYIDLSKCYKFSKDLFIKDKLCCEIPKISLSKMDELMKKLKNNYNFVNYPEEVKDRINDYINNCEYTNKDILYNPKTKQMIIIVAKITKYLCINVSYVPTYGYAEMTLDGYKCYLDILNPFYLDNIDDFVLNNISSVYEDVFKQKENDIVYAKDTLDVSSLENLPFGSVISSSFNGKIYVLIKIGQHQDGIDYLIREKNSMGSEYTFVMIPYSFNLNYNFMHILGDKKLAYAKTRIKKKN